MIKWVPSGTSFTIVSSGSTTRVNLNSYHLPNSWLAPQSGGRKATVFKRSHWEVTEKNWDIMVSKNLGRGVPRDACLPQFPWHYCLLGLESLRKMIEKGPAEDTPRWPWVLWDPPDW
jgi:hypothetical protein